MIIVFLFDNLVTAGKRLSILNFDLFQLQVLDYYNIRTLIFCNAGLTAS